MKKVKILWSGITGRTATHAKEIIKECPYAEIVAGVCRNNLEYYHYDELDKINEEFDVIVDFSNPKQFDKMIKFAIENNKPIILGTAGLTDEQVKKYEDAAKIIPVFRGGNFRSKVKVFIDKVLEYVKSCDKDEFEIVETHYKGKKVPSETAKVIAKRIKDETDKKSSIKSYCIYDGLINDWRVDDLSCRVESFYELAEDILDIALVMKYQTSTQLYDLDGLYRENNITNLHEYAIKYAEEDDKINKKM